MRNVYKIFVSKPDNKRLLEDLSVDRRIILKSCYNKRVRRYSETGKGVEG
jgi:hypothetical protein